MKFLKHFVHKIFLNFDNITYFKIQWSSMPNIIKNNQNKNVFYILKNCSHHYLKFILITI